MGGHLGKGKGILGPSSSAHFPCGDRQRSQASRQETTVTVRDYQGEGLISYPLLVGVTQVGSGKAAYPCGREEREHLCDGTGRRVPRHIQGKRREGRRRTGRRRTVPVPSYEAHGPEAATEHSKRGYSD